MPADPLVGEPRRLPPDRGHVVRDHGDAEDVGEIEVVESHQRRGSFLVTQGAQGAGGEPVVGREDRGGWWVQRKKFPYGSFRVPHIVHIGAQIRLPGVVADSVK